MTRFVTVCGAGLLAGLAAACARTSVPVPPVEDPRPALHVLSVGIETYGAEDLTQHSAEADAESFVDSLRALGGGAFRLQVQSLRGAAATPAAFRTALATVARQAQPDDAFVLYLRTLGSPAFLVLADSTPLYPPADPGAGPPPTLRRRLVLADSLAQWLVAIRTRSQMLVLDAPDAANLFHDIRQTLATAPAAGSAPALTVLAMDGPPIETAGADGARRAVLSDALLRALGALSRTDGVILASDLVQAVFDRLDHPTMSHQAGADIVLAATDAATAAALLDQGTWPAPCQEPGCPRVTATGIANRFTLEGRAEGLPAGTLVFVNGRRARFAAADRWEVELAPAAMEGDLRVRMLLPDGRRFESVVRLDR